MDAQARSPELNLDNASSISVWTVGRPSAILPVSAPPNPITAAEIKGWIDIRGLAATYPFEKLRAAFYSTRLAASLASL